MPKPCKEPNPYTWRVIETILITYEVKADNEQHARELYNHHVSNPRNFKVILDEALDYNPGHLEVERVNTEDSTNA